MAPENPVAGLLTRRSRPRAAEFALWAAALAALVLWPTRHLILNEIAILGLFAVSLDLVLGYAGIVSLGHAAFFGVGAYAAGLLAKWGWGDPVLGLAVAALVAGALGLLTAPLLLRGSDLTRLMVTLGIALVLGEIANRMSDVTGGADGLQGVLPGPVLGLFEFDIFGTTGFAYSLAVTFVLVMLARRIVGSPFGLSLVAIRDNAVRARAVGVPVSWRLATIYGIAAAYAGIAGALLAQTTQFVSLDVLAFHRSADLLVILIIGGTGYLYGGLVGAVVFRVLQDVIAGLTPQYWQFWIGLILVVFVLVGRERLAGLVRRLRPGTA